MEDHSTLLNDNAKPIGFVLWLALPLIPIGLVGWILYEAMRIRVRRGYLTELERFVGDYVSPFVAEENGLVGTPMGFTLLEHLGRKNPRTKKRAHAATLFIVILGMAVFMLLFGGLVAFLVTEAWRATELGDAASYVVVGLGLFYATACGLAFGVLRLVLTDDGDLFRRAHQVSRGEGST